ncbi:hypothetical protein LINPERHAP1_LOCUS21779, partial [Linum perenne]
CSLGTVLGLGPGRHQSGQVGWPGSHHSPLLEKDSSSNPHL